MMPSFLFEYELVMWMVCVDGINMNAGYKYIKEEFGGIPNKYEPQENVALV